jgi:protein-tyrosine phosphatase
MIDCHCHMLPGLDDGAKSLDIALEMASVATSSGVSDILLTPHHNDGLYLNSREEILSRVKAFQEELDCEGLPLKIYPGSECHVVPELPDHLEKGIACTYADQNRAVLLELPKNALPLGAEQIIEQVEYLGFQPVIAHPERNSVLCREPERIRDWFERGWKFQLTNQSCSGEFGEGIQKVCYQWLKHGWIHFIASDAHRSAGRSPDMRKGVNQISEWFGEEVATLLSCDNPGRLISGEAIVDMPRATVRQKRKGFRLWW